MLSFFFNFFSSFFGFVFVFLLLFYLISFFVVSFMVCFICDLFFLALLFVSFLGEEAILWVSIPMVNILLNNGMQNGDDSKTHHVMNSLVRSNAYKHRVRIWPYICLA